MVLPERESSGKYRVCAWLLVSFEYEENLPLRKVSEKGYLQEVQDLVRVSSPARVISILTGLLGKMPISSRPN